MRRDFVGALVAAGGASAVLPSATLLSAANQSRAGGPVEDWRRLFPALEQRVNGRPLVYLDTAATSLRPKPVIDALVRYYSFANANPGAALHTLARRAAEAYEAARQTVAAFVNANSSAEVVFTRGTTEALNLVAAAWGGANLRPGDEILLGLAEHSSNMLPWQMVAKRSGAVVRYFGIDDVGHPLLDDFSAKLTPRTRIVAFSHVSNVLGMVNPAKEMCARARAPGRIVVIDGAQSVPHFPVDVRELGCDFLAFSSHKMLGPMGIGVLWGRHELLESMPPYQSGSNMAHDVDVDSLEISEGALKFGAGTPNVAGPVGLAAAMHLIREIGHAELWRHEQDITQRMLSRLRDVRGVRLLGSADPAERISVFSFTVEGRQPADVLRALDAEGIAIRAGDLASLPLLKRLGTTRAARASCYLYTTTDEIDRVADGLERIARAQSGNGGE
jgi:cysteine desulfurase/selenocysteine lyase